MGLSLCVPIFIDIHTHRANNTNPAIINATDEYEKLDAKLFYSVGIHPCSVENSELESRLMRLEKVVIEPNVLAIGECGLDRHCGTDFETQKKIFNRQVEMANEIKKPLIIHCVRAHEDLLLMLRKQKCKVPVLIHGFNNKLSIAKKYLESGYYLSFGTSIFNEAQSDVIKSTSPDQLFFETDNSEMDIESIYKRGSKLLEMEISDLMLQIEKNATNLLSNKKLPWKISAG